MARTDPVTINSIGRQLQLAIQQLEEDFDRGRLNRFSLRALGDAAVILDQPDIAERVVHLLDIIPNDAFFAGALTNLDLPLTPPKAMRELSSKEVVEREYPPFDRDLLVTRLWSMATTENHIKYVLEGKIDQAIAA